MTVARCLVCCSVSVCLLASRSGASAQSIPSPSPVVADRDAATSTLPSSTVHKGSPLFDDLFRPLARDFRQLGAKRNLLLVGVGMGAAATSHAWDRQTAASNWGVGALHEALAEADRRGAQVQRRGGEAAGETERHARGRHLCATGANTVRHAGCRCAPASRCRSASARLNSPRRSSDG